MMMEADWKALEPHLALHLNAFPPSSSGYEDFRWCITIVLTRYCELDIGGRTVVLAPMYDMSNHDPHTKTSFAWNAETRSLIVTSGKAYSAGEQIFMSYGSKANFDLLYVYGIAFVGNPFGAVRVGIPQLPTDHKQVIEAIAGHNQVSFAMRKIHRANNVYKVPDDLLMMLRVALLRKYDLERLGITNWNATENKERGIHANHQEVAPQYYVYPLEPISIYNELCVFTFLTRSLVRRYAKYATSIGADWAMHNNTEYWRSIERKRRLAMVFRVDEKQNVLHSYRTIQARRTEYLHDQLGGWTIPAALKQGSIGAKSPRKPTFKDQQRWDG